MPVTVKHSKVSTIPDDSNTDLVRPSDWNADHTLVGTIDVPNGGTGATTLTGYVKGNGTSAMTASATVPSTDITGLGTMSTQNANAVTITGGTINGTTIGATTPSTVNATTITGQTGVLRGTGQNFQIRSEEFDNAAWNKTNINVTANTTTAPNGTLTAEKIIATNTTAQHYIDQNAAIALNAVYVFSVYAKASEYTTMALRENSVGQVAVFNLSTGIPTPNANLNPVMVDVGNGWYRCSITRQNLQAQIAIRIHPNQEASFTGDNVSGIFIWGAQSELASTAGTYIPTTTTAVYGTPTLSFSGVSTIGLESNGALYLQPAGTGALQAQATTSTTAGGNARGANAVDWQTLRNAAGQVASGAYSVISGGDTNTASGFNASINGGTGGTAGATYSFIGGGYFNTANGRNSSVVTGYTNTAGGFFNFIGGGFTNSGTSGSAVTTQATTTVTSGSTSVTLSGSNASIRVGQLITGTGIQTFPHTYVSAISGTTLTLSQNATATGTPTLSFFTPHGVVVGGGNNQATGSYSFIGGGGDAGTAANRNVASGDWSVVAGGNRNVASGNFSFVGGGFTNTASATGAFIGGGGNFGSQAASGVGAFIGAGWGNTASGAASAALGIGHTTSGDYSASLGGSFGLTRAIVGNTVFAASNAPYGTAFGCQAALIILARQTTDATPTALCSNSSAAGTTNQVILPNNSAYFFRGEVISGVTGGGDAKGWTIEGVIKRGANAASTALVGTPTVVSTYADVGAATWAIAVTADTTNGGLRVTFTGQLATTIRTVCRINTVEMTF